MKSHWAFRRSTLIHQESDSANGGNEVGELLEPDRPPANPQVGQSQCCPATAYPADR